MQSTVDAERELMSEIRGNPFWLAIAEEDPRSQFRSRYCTSTATFLFFHPFLPFPRRDILEGIMESVSSDAGIKTTRAPAYPVPTVITLITDSLRFFINTVLLFPTPCNQREKFEGTTLSSVCLIHRLALAISSGMF